MENSITYAAMDTHKKSHEVALYYPGNPQIERFSVHNNASEISKMVKKSSRKHPLKFNSATRLGCVASISNAK